MTESQKDRSLWRGPKVHRKAWFSSLRSYTYKPDIDTTPVPSFFPLSVRHSVPKGVNAKQNGKSNFGSIIPEAYVPG